MDEEDGVDLAQEPGSFYVGNLRALDHNARCHDECSRTFDPEAATAQGHRKAATAVNGPQIAAMIRSDVFRNARARKINAAPGPVYVYRVVNWAVAQHLAESPAQLPDLTAALAGA